MSKHQSREGDGRGVSGLLPPSRWHLGKNRAGRRETERRAKYSVWEKRRVEGRKSDARKKRRRRRRIRRAAQKIRTAARARSRAGELVVGTYNARTLAFKGTNGIGHAEVILKTCEDAGCDIIGLQEVKRNGQGAFTAAGCVVFCSGADGGKHEKKGNHGVGLAVREPIVAGMDEGEVAVECISARLMKVRIQLKGKTNGVSFIVGYAPTLDKSTSEKNYFWSSLDEVVKGVPSRDHLLVLMDATARTGMRGIGWTDGNVLGAYGRDELNDNGARLLIHASDNNVALLNTYYATSARGISYTFQSPNREKAQYRLDFILTRQVDRRLVRNVTVRTPPRENAESDHNLVIGNIRLLGRTAPNRPKGIIKNRRAIDLPRLMANLRLRMNFLNAIAAKLSSPIPGKR